MFQFPPLSDAAVSCSRSSSWVRGHSSPCPPRSRGRRRTPPNGGPATRSSHRRAAGGWIGGYQIGDTPIFLITPTREPNRQGYQRDRVVDDLSGRGGATRAETKRAAWILSKYGGYRDATQAAAVDASVYAVLVGGRWSTTGARGARRIHEAPEWATVLRFARIMLKQSRLHAGQYRARVKATNADAGGTIEATVKVTDGHGRPAAGLPVTVDAAGAAAVEAVTGDNGRAVTRFAVSQPGWHRITATVREVPEHRLHLRLPVRQRQAALPREASGGSSPPAREPPYEVHRRLLCRPALAASGGFGGTGHRFGDRRRLRARPLDSTDPSARSRRRSVRVRQSEP